MTNDQVEILLQEAGLWHGRVTLHPLKGGYLNEVLLVQTGEAKLVLKRFVPESTGTLFPNQPEKEARALQRRLIRAVARLSCLGKSAASRRRERGEARSKKQRQTATLLRERAGAAHLGRSMCC